MRPTATSFSSWSTTSIRSRPASCRMARPISIFRGFYCWNSEVGARTLGIASFYLRAVCQNRNLWGVEDFEEITIRHSKYAASRFAYEAEPALIQFADSSPMPFVNGIKAARERIVARDDEDRTTFLRKRGFSKTETTKIIDTVLLEEGRPPESVFDFVQGITRVARDKPHQDARLDMEGKAKEAPRSRGLTSTRAPAFVAPPDHSLSAARWQGRRLPRLSPPRLVSIHCPAASAAAAEDAPKTNLIAIVSVRLIRRVGSS